MRKVALIGAGVLILTGCSSAASETDAELTTPSEPVVEREAPYVLQQVPQLTIELTSDAVGDNGRLGGEYTCEGAHTLTPPLSWSGAPADTQSFVLLLEDAETDEPPGGLWTHWIVYSIPPDAAALDSIPVAGADLGNGAKLGTNDYGALSYLGPCPKPSLVIGPSGSSHMSPASLRHYYFRIYALDRDVELGPGATRNELLHAIDGHVLAAGELAPKYRSRLKHSAGSLSDFAPPSRSQSGHTWERLFRSIIH